MVWKRRRIKDPWIPRVVRALFLCVLPPVVLLSFWHAVTPEGWYPWFLVAAAFVWLRVLSVTAFSFFATARSHPRRDLEPPIRSADLARLQEYCAQEPDGVGAQQLRVFALSVLGPSVIRRRVTDEYVPDRRTLSKKVSIEIDIDDRFLPWMVDPPNDTKRVGDVFVALTLPKKGELYDKLKVTNSSGELVPTLSHREYRIVAAKTIRFLLRAAFRTESLPPAALEAEALALREIIRFSQIERVPDESSEHYQDRARHQRESQDEAIQAIQQLSATPGLDGEGDRYLKLAVELTHKLSSNYAVVAVVAPGALKRFLISYRRTIIPDLRISRRISPQGLRDRLRILLGSRPVFLSVNARNAASCHSYHLVLTVPDDQYLADFDVSSLEKLVRRNGRPPGSMEPYWRVRGRRGQNYFHLYTRAIQTEHPELLTARLRFHEVPPGSIGRAGAAAVATCLVVLIAGIAVSALVAGGNPALDRIDTQIAAFLLAVPGLASAWLGFESGAAALLQGSLTARLSLLLSFMLSLASSTVLLLQKADLIEPRVRPVLVLGAADPYWLVLMYLSLINAIAVILIWWSRSYHYRKIATKPVGNSAVTSIGGEED